MWDVTQVADPGGAPQSPRAALQSCAQGTGASGVIGPRSGALQAGASGAIGSGAGAAHDPVVGRGRLAHDADGFNLVRTSWLVRRVCRLVLQHWLVHGLVQPATGRMGKGHKLVHKT
ncbi:hypothetical protein RIF29_14522 [Crotalaria pallida]|uniref:Uncharacterized protein n=1 Tax=Crotalaria pallida TaxID=3830 RepID=A0AAN9IBQ2_CROPI